MPAITATAPGKVILFGEHAVVYHRPAIAVPVSQLRARAVIRANLPGEPGQVHIQAPQVGLDIELEELPEDHPIGLALRSVLQTLKIQRPPACVVRVSSTIPIAAGLGSGAAISVALIRAFAGFLGHPLPDNLVSSLAYQVEVLHHGTPSGIDNTVITYSQPVYFVKDQPIEILRVSKPITFVVADTGIHSPTVQTVSHVRRAWQSDPGRLNSLFDAIAAIVRSARTAIELGDPFSLGPMMDENHHLLVKLGVSSPELENLVRIAREAGALGAKLSGGGGGGNMIAMAPPQDVEAITEALRLAGAKSTFITSVRQTSPTPLEPHI